MNKDDKEFLASILSIFDSHKLNLKLIMNWPVTTKSWSIRNVSGENRPTNKSSFRQAPLGLNPSKPEQLHQQVSTAALYIL